MPNINDIKDYLIRNPEAEGQTEYFTDMTTMGVRYAANCTAIKREDIKADDLLLNGMGTFFRVNKRWEKEVETVTTYPSAGGYWFTFTIEETPALVWRVNKWDELAR